MRRICKSLVPVLLLVMQQLAAQDSTSIASAFFGLDDALPFTANALCLGAMNRDGMPLNFRCAIDNSSLDASDFEVIDSSGNSHIPFCVTLAPANEVGEERTVLLIGDFGTAGSNPPVEVRVIGDLFTLPKDEHQSACSEVKNLNGAFTRNVVPLAAGPSLYFAQRIGAPLTECPAGTSQTIQVAWDGGVVPISSTIAESDLYQFYTFYSDSAGILIPHQADTIMDVNDNDNYHQLCLSTTDSIVKVDFQANTVEDPNGDPNLFTQVELRYCPDTLLSSVVQPTTMPSIAVFPNPARESLIVECTGLEGLMHWQLISVEGKLQLEGKEWGQETFQVHIDISTLKAGCYFLQCANGEKQLSKKIIVY